MRFFRNKQTAVLISALMCLFSVFYGSYRSIQSVKKEALDYFENSEYSLKSDLQARAGYAMNLCEMCAKYVKNDIPAEISEIATVYESLNKPGLGAEEASRLNARLTKAFDSLLAKAEKFSLNADDARIIVKIQAEVQSRQDIISRSDYNKKAAALNKKINSFPASLFRRIMFIEDIELF